MRVEKNKEISNQLLDGLPAELRKTIIGQGEIVDLDFGEVLCEQGKVISHVIFPLSGFISMVKLISDHPPLDMGLIGYEGMLGITLILDIDLSPEQAVVQGAGTGLKLPTENFIDLLKHSLLLKRLNRYLYIIMAQRAQSLVCARFHRIEPRLARWLLMTRDRARSTHLQLTHKFLANMLGVRRSGITIAAGVLQGKKLIKYSRGDIHIVDRKGLEMEACECYELSKFGYARLLK